MVLEMMVKAGHIVPILLVQTVILRLHLGLMVFILFLDLIHYASLRIN